MLQLLNDTDANSRSMTLKSRVASGIRFRLRIGLLVHFAQGKPLETSANNEGSMTSTFLVAGAPTLGGVAKRVGTQHSAAGTTGIPRSKRHSTDEKVVETELQTITTVGVENRFPFVHSRIVSRTLA